MDSGAIDAIFIILSSFGGVAAIIGASGWAKAVRIRAERQANLLAEAADASDSIVLAELKAMKQQMAEMHGTSHQFDLSFDDALNRLESRVSRIETKAAAPHAPAYPPEETQRVGGR